MSDIIDEFARVVVADHLDDGIEFSAVYEREDVPTGFGDEELAKVHDRALAMLRQIEHDFRGGKHG